MIRVRHGILGDAYMLDNGKKALRIDEDYIDKFGVEIKNQWIQDANPVIDMISTVEVGGEYMIDEIPERNGTVIMSMNSSVKNWLVLVAFDGKWHFGNSEYTIPDVFKKCEWKVLEVRND